MPLELPQNYFELFQLPCALDIDAERLAARYRALQRELHPDRFATAGVREQRLAAQAAAHVNHAHRVLSDPHERATYLLQLQGCTVDDERDTTHDAEFLMCQMERREELEGLNDAAAAAAFATRLGSEAEALWADFAACYAARQWTTARDVLLKLRFYRRLRQQLQVRQTRLAEA